MRASKRKISNKNILDNRYIIISEIDSGLTSHVYKVLDKKTGKTRVAKIYENNYEKLFNKEVQIFQLFEQQDNPNIIRCYEFGFDQTKRKPYIIQEYGSKGCLMDSILKLKCAFTEDVCKYILLNLINAVDALHQKGFCHRDIKPENIVLVGDNYDIKLIDFGFATKYINEENQKIKLGESFGTQYYRAPEIIEKKPYDGTKVDIFSIGATLFILMTKNYGYIEATINNISLKSENRLYKLIKTEQYNEYWKLIYKTKNVKDLSTEFKNLFLKMVAYDPEKRPTIEEIRNDAFMADVVNASEEYLDFLRQKMIDQIEFALH